MKKVSNTLYQTPQMSVLDLVVEGCLAASAPGYLDDMDKNEVYDELF